MLGRSILVLSAMLWVAAPLQAKDCPVEEPGLDARENAIRNAPSCKQAMAIMEACAYGTSGDTGLGGAVHEKCEPEFLPKLIKAQKRAYDREQKRCDNKYARQSGTMYRSFTAFCQARSAMAYAAKFGARNKARK